MSTRGQQAHLLIERARLLPGPSVSRGIRRDREGSGAYPEGVDESTHNVGECFGTFGWQKNATICLLNCRVPKQLCEA